MGLKLGSGTVPTNRHTTIPNDSGPISACFDDDPKLLNCVIAQPSPGSGGQEVKIEALPLATGRVGLGPEPKIQVGPRCRILTFGRSRRAAITADATNSTRSRAPHSDSTGLKHFRLRNSACGPAIVDVWALNAPLLPQNTLEKVGGEAPHLFHSGLCDRKRAVETPKIDEVRPGSTIQQPKVYAVRREQKWHSVKAAATVATDAKGRA